jgi:hypothetical protein
MQLAIRAEQAKKLVTLQTAEQQPVKQVTN